MAASRFVQVEDKLRPVHFALGAVVVALGFALRWFAAADPMWLDEIWSLGTALSLDAWHKPFWTGFIDNSHPMNTVWLYLMGDGRSPYVYRFLAIVLSTISIAAAGWAMTRGRGRNAASAMPVRVLSAMALMAVMYPFVHYGSEARGYAGMMLFALLAFAAAEDSVNGAANARWRFALWGTLGLASHAGSVPVMAFLALGHALTVWHEERCFKTALDATVRLCAPYGVVLSAFIANMLYDATARHSPLVFGGASDTCDGRACFVDSLAQIVRFSTGGFDAGPNGLYAALVGVITVSWVGWLAARGHRRWIFYAAVLLVQSLTYIAVSMPTMPYGRYLLGMAVFWPLLAADVLGEIHTERPLARFIVVAAFIALVAVNVRAIKMFFDTGRGGYPDAVAALLNGRSEGVLTVGTNRVFQFSTVAYDIIRNTAPHVTFHPVATSQLPDVAHTHVVIVTASARNARPVYCLGTTTYRHQATYSYWGLSGQDWALYARTDQPPPSGDACPSIPR